MKKVIAFYIFILIASCQGNNMGTQNGISDKTSVKHTADTDPYVKTVDVMLSYIRNGELDKICDMANLDCYAKEIWPNVRSDIKIRFKKAQNLINAFGIAPKEKWKITTGRIPVDPFGSDTSTVLFEKILVTLNRSDITDTSVLYFGIEFNCTGSPKQFYAFDILERNYQDDFFYFSNNAQTAEQSLPPSMARTKDFIDLLKKNDRTAALSAVTFYDKSDPNLADICKQYELMFDEISAYTKNRELAPTSKWKLYTDEQKSKSGDYSVVFHEVVIPFATKPHNDDDPVYLYVGFEKNMGNEIHEFGIITRKISGADGDRLAFRHLLSEEQHRKLHSE